MIVTLNGQSAITVAGLANRLPEVLTGSTWKAARSVSACVAELKRGSEVVRLRSDVRLLVEDILRDTNPPRDPFFLKDWLRNASLNGTVYDRGGIKRKVDEVQRSALMMLSDAITA